MDCPPIETLISQTPIVIDWLRDQMFSREYGMDDDLITTSGAGSKPPMPVALVDAADKEFANLAYWCEYLGVMPVGRTFRANGRIIGIVDEQLPRIAANTLVSNLPNPLPEGFLLGDHGLWETRRKHLGSWPGLRGLFAPEEKVDETVDDGLFRV